MIPFRETALCEEQQEARGTGHSMAWKVLRLLCEQAVCFGTPILFQDGSN